MKMKFCESITYVSGKNDAGELIYSKLLGIVVDEDKVLITLKTSRRKYQIGRQAIVARYSTNIPFTAGEQE
jgi:hypothetical protein